jgi:acyl-CoA synthetase (AMP-forming)/AMP-acid ligase II
MTSYKVAARSAVHPSRADWSLGPPAVALPGQTLPGVLQWLAERRPDQPLFHVLDLHGETTTLTAGALWTRANSVAQGLRQAGLVRGNSLLLAGETSPELLAAFFGCGLAGVIPCLVSLPTTAAQRLSWPGKLRTCLDVVRASAVIADACWVETVQDATGPGSVHSFSGLEAAGQSTAQAAATATAPPHELAFSQFTSGTTNRPKAIAISHQALIANATGLARTAAWREGDLLVGWLPLHHDMGLVATTLAAFLHGLPCVLMPPAAFMLKPARWLWAIHAFRGTQSFAPNFAYQFAAGRIPDRDLEGLSLASWRRAYNAAEFIHERTLEQFCKRFEPYGFDRDAIYPAYGLAENTVGVSCRVPEDPLVFDRVSRPDLIDHGRALPAELHRDGRDRDRDRHSPDEQSIACVGRPFPGTEVRIVDDAWHELPDRHVGRIVLRGNSLFSGYLGDGEATRARFRDGWFDTGDLGYLVAGRLHITGRTKDLIIKAGQNIAPYPLEFAASGVEGVRAGCVAALAVLDVETGTEDLVVVFETARRDPHALDALKREISDRIRSATGIAPDRLVALLPHQVPKTTSGKIRRAELRRMLETEIKIEIEDRTGSEIEVGAN